MAADEKTKKATPKWRQDERKKGNVFQSSDVAAAYSILVVFYTLEALAPRMYRNFRQGIYLFFSYGGNPDRFLTQLGREMLTKAMMPFLETALPLLFIDILVAVAVIFFQTRMASFMDMLKFEGEHINPLKRFKRMMSVRSVVELIRTLIKITILGWVTYDFLKGRMRELAVLMEGSVEGALTSTGNMIISLVDTVGMVFVSLAALDYIYQWWEYEKNLCMNKQEVKEEYKQTEGDPQIKGKIREKQRRMASKCTIQNVPKVDVIIHNPIHYAITSGYDSSQSRIPVVLVKEADYSALKTVEAGETDGIYILGDKPLAKRLYASVGMDAEIPEECYQAVVGILALMYKPSRKDI